MKKLFVLIAALPFVFASCGGNLAEEIVGTWKFTEVDFNIEGSMAETAKSVLGMDKQEVDDVLASEITFLEDGTCFIDGRHGTYKTDGNKLTITPFDGPEITVKISGQNIQFTMDCTAQILEMVGLDGGLALLMGTVTKGAIEKAEIIVKGTKM